jgi:hypothetical protein
MPGMNSGVNVNSPLVTAAFKSALHQWIIAMVIFGALGLAWLTLRAWLPAAAGTPGGAGSSPGPVRAAGQLLGAAAHKVELVAVVANPVYHQVADTQAFDRQERLDHVPNWRYLTGAVPQLRQVWKDYGIAAVTLPGGSMIGHNAVAYVIDQAGRVRAELSTDPGPGTTATKSSLAVLLANTARQVLRPS